MFMRTPERWTAAVYFATIKIGPIMQKSVVALDEVKVNYEITRGKKQKAFVFLHGLGGDLRAWDKERKILDDIGYTTLAIDLRGHGLSGRPETREAYSFGNFALDVELVLQRENLSNIVLIGHCFGGMVSLMHAYLYPKFITSLILIDTSYKPPHFSEFFAHHKVFEYLIPFFASITPPTYDKSTVDYEKFIHTSDFDKKRIFSDIMHTSLKSYLLISQNLLHFDAKEILNAIKIPTLVIEGTKDSVFPPEIAVYLHKKIKSSEITFIKGANHIVVLTNPKEVTEAIVEFIKA
jgi:pimeloyl-ACP methyl ester carboxylesterase